MSILVLDMARKTLLQLLLTAGAALTFAGCTGCEGTGQLNPDDDDDTGDDDTTTEAPYTAEDISFDWYATQGNLTEVDCDTSNQCFENNEGDGGLGALNANDAFFEEGNLLYNERKITLEANGLMSDSVTIDDVNHTMNVNFGMYDANKTILSDGSVVKIKEETPMAKLSIKDDLHMEDLEITVTFDTYLNNQAPTLDTPVIDLGRVLVGQTIPGGNILDLAGRADREDAIESEVYDNSSDCEPGDGEIPGMSLNGCDFPEFEISEVGDFSYEIDVVDPQGEYETATVIASAFSYPTVDVLVSDFFTNGVLTDGNSDIVSYITVECDDQGTPDFSGSFVTDLLGYANFEIVSPAIAAGAASIDCRVVSDDETNPLDVADYAAVKVEATLSGGDIAIMSPFLLSIETYDGNAQTATGARNTVDDLYNQNGVMEVAYGVNANGAIFAMGSGLPVTSELIDGDAAFYAYALSDYVNNVDPSLTPPGYSGVLVQDAAGGSIAIDWDSNVNLVDVNRVLTGTNINNGNVTLGDGYYYDFIVEAAGMFIATGSISGAVEEGDISYIDDLMFSNGSGYSFHLPQKQLMIRQLYTSETGHDLFDICVSPYNICNGYDDGPADQ